MDSQNAGHGSGSVAPPDQPDQDGPLPVTPIGPSGPVVPKIIVQIPPPPRPSFWRRLGRSLLVLSVMLNVYFILSALSAGAPEKWEESIEAGGASVQDRIVVLELDGAIAGHLVDRVISQIKQAERDKNVKGVIVEINSPGGTITGSDAIYHYLRKLGEKKPVAVCMEDLCASGGYYVSMAAKRVFAHPTGWTGSIGVILTLVNVVKLADDVGVKVEVVKSGNSKDMGSPFRAMAVEERDYFQKLVDEAYSRFVKIVADRRGIEMEQLRPLADGRVLSAKQALAGKLIDEIGFLEDAIAFIKTSAGIEEAQIVRYKARFSLSGILMSQSTRPVELKLKLPWGSLLRTGHPQPLYLWPAVGLRTELGTVIQGR